MSMTTDDQPDSRLKRAINSTIILYIVRVSVPVGLSFAGWMLNHAAGAFDRLSDKVDQITVTNAATTVTLEDHQRQISAHTDWLLRLQSELNGKAAKK